MITLAKLFLVTIVASAGACGIGSLGTAVYLYSGGIAAVDVETADVDLFIPVPLRILDVGLGVARIAAPDFDIESELDAETRERLREMQPMIEELVDELGSLPSGESGSRAKRTRLGGGALRARSPQDRGGHP